VGRIKTENGTASHALTPPEKLTESHAVEAFESGEESLDAWLKQQALANEKADASRTYVVCAERRVVGYYCLSTGSVIRTDAPGQVRRNMPDPIPVMILGRLAIDRAWQRRGIGRALLRDAVLRTLRVSYMVGVKALLVYAISEPAKLFYQQAGFRSSPTDPLTLFLSIRDAKQIFRDMTK